MACASSRDHFLNSDELGTTLSKPSTIWFCKRTNRKNDIWWHLGVAAIKNHTPPVFSCVVWLLSGTKRMIISLMFLFETVESKLRFVDKVTLGKWSFDKARCQSAVNKAHTHALAYAHRQAPANKTHAHTTASGRHCCKPSPFCACSLCSWHSLPACQQAASLSSFYFWSELSSSSTEPRRT